MTDDQTSNPVRIGPVRIGKDCPLALIAGPCVMEPGDMTLRIARHLAELGGALGIPLVFKASFDKANRTSGSSFRGPGLSEGLKIFERVKAETGSVQRPGGGTGGTASSGQREMIPTLARAAVAAGCDALFLEVHPDPDRALSDGPNSLRLDDLPALLRLCLRIRQAISG